MTRKITEDVVRKIVRSREAHLHKGDCGRVLIGAGSVGMAGAAILAARGALRSGAGLVRVAVPSELVTILQIAVPEATCIDRGQLLASIAGASSASAASTATASAGVDNSKNANGRPAAGKAAPALADYNAICIGPGLGEEAESIAFVKAMLTSYGGVLIVDADALNIIAHNDMLGLLRDRAEHWPDTTVITPHIGEARRLLAAAGKASNAAVSAADTRNSSLQDDRPAALIAAAAKASYKTQSENAKAGTGFAAATASAARSFDFSGAAPEAARLDIAAALVEATRAIVVLKGSGTIVAAAGREVFINTTGNPGMATGGSGDVLAGVITGLAGQKRQICTELAAANTAAVGAVDIAAATASRIGAYDAAVAGVYIHGLAGDLAAIDLGEYGLISGDLPLYVAMAIKKITE